MNIISIIGWIFKIAFFLAITGGVLILIFWKKTKLPKMLERYKAQKALESQLKYEAKAEALEQLKPQLVEAYKKKEIERMTATTADKVKRFTKNMGIQANPDKIREAFGGRGVGGPAPNRTVDNILGRPQAPPQYQQPPQPRRRQPKRKQQPRQTQPRPQPRPRLQPQQTGFNFNSINSSYDSKQKEHEKRMKDLLR